MTMTAMTNWPAMVIVISAMASCGPRCVLAAEKYTAHVGMSQKILGVIVPGTPLRIRPIKDDLNPLVLRILDSYAHGTAWRYDLEFMGLEAGAFRLSDFVERQDGSEMGDLPVIEFEILSSIPPGQITPHELSALALSRLGGYRRWLVLAVIGWITGLAWLIMSGFKRKQLAKQANLPKSLADYLRPHLQAASAGKLAPEQFAELERMVTAYWRRRLNLQHEEVSQAIAAIKADQQAGPLVRELERAMHDPSYAGQADWGQLLGPLESIAIEDAEAATALL
jgi:hypothetical protein